MVESVFDSHPDTDKQSVYLLYDGSRHYDALIPLGFDQVGPSSTEPTPVAAVKKEEEQAAAKKKAEADAARKREENAAAAAAKTEVAAVKKKAEETAAAKTQEVAAATRKKSTLAELKRDELKQLALEERRRKQEKAGVGPGGLPLDEFKHGASTSRASTSRESKCGPESWSQPNSGNEVSSNVRDLNFYTLSILIYLCYLCYLFSYINLYNLQCVCVCVCVCVCRLTQPRSRLGPQRRSSLRRWTSHCIPETGQGVRLQESV
jgi:Ca2+-dependent lipid-binding protein